MLVSTCSCMYRCLFDKKSHSPDTILTVLLTVYCRLKQSAPHSLIATETHSKEGADQEAGINKDRAPVFTEEKKEKEWERDQMNTQNMENPWFPCQESSSLKAQAGLGPNSAGEEGRGENNQHY